MLDFLIKQKGIITKILILFYIIGATGFMIPALSKIFFLLTPLALLISFIILMLYHESRYDYKTILIFFIIYILGFFIEVLGVNSGLIFGSYRYGLGLGFKIWETPLIIGINWLLLTYATHSIVNKCKIAPILRILLGSCFMLIYDIILEQAAPYMDMWSFAYLEVPIKNYIVWVFLSFFFHSLLTLFKIETKNKMASTLFLIQIAFFTLLSIYFRILL